VILLHPIGALARRGGQRAPWKEDGFARRKEEADETLVISNRPVAAASPEEAMSAEGMPTVAG
jgi:hypothetical protein